MIEHPDKRATVTLAGPQDFCVQHLAHFHPHSTNPGTFCGVIDGRAYVLHTVHDQDGKPAMTLSFNPTATMLIEADKADR